MYINIYNVDGVVCLLVFMKKKDSDRIIGYFNCARVRSMCVCLYYGCGLVLCMFYSIVSGKAFCNLMNATELHTSVLLC